MARTIIIEDDRRPEWGWVFLLIGITLYALGILPGRDEKPPLPVIPKVPVRGLKSGMNALKVTITPCELSNTPIRNGGFYKSVFMDADDPYGDKSVIVFSKQAPPEGVRTVSGTLAVDFEHGKPVFYIQDGTFE